MIDRDPYGTGSVWDDYQRDRLREEQERAEVVPDWRPAPRVKRRDAPKAGWSWKQAVLERDQGCCVHPNPADCAEGWQAHHVVPQQELRRQGLTYAINHPLSGMGVCGKAHRQHHSGGRVIWRHEIPAAVKDFLVAQGMAYHIDRHYPERDSDPGDEAQTRRAA